jgi:hypothetical protein
MLRAQRTLWTLVLAGVVCLGMAGAAVAAPREDAVADLNAGPTGIEWRPVVEYERIVLTVSGPGGFILRNEFAAGVSPSLALFDKSGNPLRDGSYNYELRVTPRIAPDVKQKLADARARGKDGAAQAELRQAGRLPQGPVQSGAFAVKDGAFVVAGETEPRGEGGVTAIKDALRPVTAADQVIPDDLIVQGSLCVGFDCVNNENFGFDTIRLKENNLRIKFEDTSVGSFPTNDWQLTANDSASGGQSKFSIEDITGAKVPFTVEAGSTTNSIYVDSTGRVGLRTSTPVLDLHINTSNTPAIRLEQNNSGGFTAQTWDIAGNEANFFVRDVTGGSRLPFRIRPGAPTSSIDISADGDVGIGTASPDSSLHVFGSDGSTQLKIEETNGAASQREMFLIENNGGISAVFDDTSLGTRWVYGTNGNNFIWNEQVNAGVEMTLSNTGNLTITGTYTPASSRSVKENFSGIEPREVLRKVLDLPISTWSYRRDPGVRHIGPMSEDFYTAFAVGTDDKGISVTDSAGVTLAAIQGLNQVVQEKDREISDLKSRIEALEKMVRSLAKAEQ